MARLRALAAGRPLAAPTTASAPAAHAPPAAPVATRDRGAGALARRAWRAVYWPDGDVPWYGAALRTTRALLGATRYDALVSVSSPFTGHVVAMRAATGARRPPVWLADIGDPLAFDDYLPPNNRRLYGWLNRRVERQLVGAADHLTVPTATVWRRYQELYPAAAHRFHHVPPLLSAGEPPVVAPVEHRPILSFVGRLYPGDRSPAYLLATFAALRALPGYGEAELHFYGNADGTADVFAPYGGLLGTRIFLHGVVPRPVALAQLGAARRCSA
jgi:hypothetical protein